MTAIKRSKPFEQVAMFLSVAYMIKSFRLEQNCRQNATS
jgi:hypothetical protein